MKTLTYTLLASALTTTLLLAPAWAETPAVTQDSAALSDVPPPQGLDGSADPQLKQAAGDAPYTPGDAAPVQENTAPAQPAESAQPAEAATPAASAAPDIVIPPVAAEAPAAAEPAGALLNQPVSSTISVAQMGQPRGITLTGGQLQSGILFTLPGDEVITNARLNLSLRVSAALASRNTSLQLMLNGQPLGTLPLGASDSDVSDYQLDIPAAMVVSSNNLSFKINDADKLLCEKESAQQYQVTILPKTTLSLEGQQLNIGTSLRNFPRPFIDVQRMTPASVTFGFAANVSPDSVSAAALVASWLGIQSDYRGIRFPVVRGDLPEHNGILIGHPGDKIGSVTLPAAKGPLLQVIDNPNNPVYKLLLVVGADDAQLRQAANRLTTQPLATDASSLNVPPQPIGTRKPYDAPRWINTSRPVRLSELLRKDQSLTTTGIWHDALRVNFRAAPDLFLWDGDAIPVNLHYRFPSESWIDENNSFLNVTLNGTFLRNLTVNKVGLLESAWHRLGGDARQEQYTLKLEPYLIYGDNQLALYFNIKPKADAPCGVLLNNNIKSRIEEDSWIDLSHTRHFTMLPNLSYFVGASFPFSRLADFSQTTLLLPEAPGDAEIATLLDMAARAGNATGVPLVQNQVLFGLPNGGTNLTRLQHSDVLAVSTMQHSAFTQQMLAGTAYQTSGNTLGVKEPTTVDKLRGWLTGDWSRQQLDADRYFSSNEAWRGFVSYRSPWSADRLVVMTVATSDQQLLRLHDDLNSARINAGIRGDTAIITDENGIRSFRVGPQFPSGEMPWYMMVVWYANQHSVLMALAALLLSALIGSAAWVMLKRHAWCRLHPKDDSHSGRK
ncbi:cellulose biosynthesis cyclic di-GMP-binding regulatory protein BcsB [Pantoea sp. ICBG 828]|uniref:cellulose biosynthesis cyclic di-GMP-binding regulatory protein BcsB n=1 Tax=unclassified Pantoea TaxID=2630326 RepID=UPI000CE2C9D7|nr:MULTISPECIES: cellulose biosynthesis cyclic di-GMP-binding regulatory protein BcsB [unclassified Pantoea]NIG35991.1 cellulose biosynthesis cyclic di-GMP-binding regulatory protein BcsB [Pantoea sp. Ap-959]PPC65757.1 cellulose biosynthesis cyclic di-GMP-binding regulatory protein BcsB [Pantoea sp. ICBG 828]